MKKTTQEHIVDVENIPMKEEYDKLYKSRSKKVIFYLENGEPVRVGDWFYLRQPDARHRSEVEPDIIEGVFKSFYDDVFVVVRLGAVGEVGKKVIHPLEEFRANVQSGKFKRLRMPLFRYADKFRNKYNLEDITIRDVPRSLNDKGDTFVYYVRVCSEKGGCNYTSMTEETITEFYNTAGVIKR